MQGTQSDNAAREREFAAQIKSAFDQMPQNITIHLYVDPKKDDYFAQVNRQVIRSFRELTDKITFREYDLSHASAKELGITRSPTLVISPERYAIRWLGAPMGEEGRTFLETLLLVGNGDSFLKKAARQVLHRIEEPRHVKIFVSPTCPYCPQEALNGVQAVIERPDMIFLEIIDIQANQDLAEEYDAHSVPQAYANEVRIGLGAQSPEIFCSSLLKLEAQNLFIPEVDDDLVENDLVVVGGGPAGLTAGIYAVRSGLKTAIVERDALGGQVATTPIVENYTGFTQVGGKNLVDIMVSHALQYVQIFQGEEVINMEREGDGRLLVQTTRRKFRTKSLLLATGATHRQLGADGEKRLAGKGVSYCSTCDGPLFVGKKVLMVGGGNSAVTEALHLRHMGVDVTIAHRRDTLRAQDMLVQRLKEAEIPVLWNTEVREIRGKNVVEEVVLYDNKTGEERIMPVNGVFLSIGYSPAVELAVKLGVELTPNGYIRHDRHRTAVPGVYSAGDVEGGYKQIVTAAGQGAEAAMAIFEDTITPYWREKENRE